MSYHTGGKSKKKKKKKVKGKKLITNKSNIQMPSVTSTVSLSNEASSTLQQSTVATAYGAESGPPPEFQTAMTTKQDEVEIEEITKEIVTKLYDGSNIRKFYGMDTMPIDDFISVILKDVPVIKIDQLNNKNETMSSYDLDIKDSKPSGKKKKKVDRNRKKKKKKKKFNLFKNQKDSKDNKDKSNPFSQSAKTQTNSTKASSLTEISEDFNYNIMIDDPKDIKGKFWEISYIGLDDPDKVSQWMYEDPPIERIPASFPDAYQNSNNPDIPTGRKCGNCIFFEAESGNCSKWNAIARDYYWCAAWQTMAPVIAQPNIFTPLINQTNNPDDLLYNFFLETVKDPISQEPNLSNFLTAFDSLHSTYNAYLYGDSLRRIVDSGNAFDFDSAPLDFIFPTQNNFLLAIDFINEGGLSEFDVPPEQYDSVQQHLCTYTLSKKANSSLPSNFPQFTTIVLHGSYFGEPINILSQLDFTNAKIAYNPKSNGDIKHILIDSRYGQIESNAFVHIDILRDSIRERLLKYLAENSIPYKLDGNSCFKFIQWVADRSYNSETMQALYQYLITRTEISSNDDQLIQLIENSLGEQLVDDPVTVPLPVSGLGGT